MPFARNADSRRFAVAVASTPWRRANRYTVGAARAPNRNPSVRCEVAMPAISSGAVSESTPITVRRTWRPVCGSRTSTNTGAKRLSSR